MVSDGSQINVRLPNQV